MGAYLSEPVVDKQTESAKGDKGIHYGATSMQGWRINQEDAHNCILKFDENSSLFAVYDGHGGAEVAQYAAMRFPEYLKAMSTWSEGRIGQALEDAFLNFDELLTRNDVMEELKVLSGAAKKDSESDDGDEDKALLYEEACLPLNDVLRRYGITLDPSIRIGRNERRLINPKLKIMRKKLVPANLEPAEGGNGAPTPPSSPDVKSGAEHDSATDKCDASSNQELAETLPLSPTHLDVYAVQEKRPRFSLKRKSIDSRIDQAEENIATPLQETPSSDNKCNAHGLSQANGIDDTGYKMGVANTDSPVRGVPLKRFKDGDDTGADSTTADAVTDAATKPRALNGSHVIRSQNAGAVSADSTTGDDGTEPVAKSTTENSLSSTTTLGVGSPMIVEEPNSCMKLEDNKITTSNKPAGSNRSCAMDESSGASDDDEDEDYNMEVEDDESSEESSNTEGIEDEVVDGADEMGVDEEAEEEEEEEEEDDEMFAVPSGDTPGVDSGTTACVVLIKGTTIYIANAGDSRCVLCRGDKAVDLSLDHKPEDPAEKRRIELAGGKITADGRVNGGLNLSRAIGDHFYKRNSELPLRDQMITSLPDVRVETMKEEDQFLVLACDGIWNSMSSQDVVDFVRTRLAKGLAPATICEQLCDVCLAPNTIGDGTGCDNMTAIVVLLNQNVTDGSSVDAAQPNATNQRTDGSEAETSCLQAQV